MVSDNRDRMDYGAEAIIRHRASRGKVSIASKMKVDTMDELPCLNYGQSELGRSQLFGRVHDQTLIKHAMVEVSAAAS